MKLLYVAESSSGGLAKYSVCQIKALLDASVDVEILCRPDYSGIGELPNSIINPLLPSLGSNLPKVFKHIHFVVSFYRASKIIVHFAQKINATVVLFDCFREYLAPVWVKPLMKLRAAGIKTATIAHDPVRDFVVGPLWWHQYSIRAAYRVMSHVFVHDKSEIDFGGLSEDQFEIHEIPHGPYEVPACSENRDAIRDRLGFTQSDMVFLSFGQVRDGKNLDLFLEAMSALPSSVKLLCAGNFDSSSQKDLKFYHELSSNLGLNDRCVWEIKYVSENDIAGYFEAADVVLLIYSKKFRSASGVLNLTSQFRKPVIGSSGDGPFKKSVLDYGLGYWCSSLNRTSIVETINSFENESLNLDENWQNYCENNSWGTNAEKVIKALS